MNYEEVVDVIETEFKEAEKGIPFTTAAVLYVYKQTLKQKLFQMTNEGKNWK